MKLELGRSWPTYCNRVVLLEAKASEGSDSTMSAARAAGIESRLNDMVVEK